MIITKKNEEMLRRGLTPIHPGRILKEDCLEPLKLSVTELRECESGNAFLP